MDNDFMNLPIDYDREDKVARMELDSIKSDSVLSDGFINNVYLSKHGFDKERVVDVTQTNLTFKDCTMRAMIGLYVLKEEYDVVEVNLYGIRYTFELTKYAVPNKLDFVTVHRTVSKAIAEVCGNREDIWKQLNDILVEIQQDEWTFVE